jgi:pyrroloquinoline quinone (PQQ) biosynthesis protein C
MPQEPEAFKERLRGIVGETFFSPPPAIFEFQRDHMSRSGALAFSLEHCQFTDTFPRWFGNIVANCPHIDVRAYMIANQYIEEVKDPTIPLGHNESMWAFARALGASEDRIRNYVPLVTTTMALHYYDNVSRTRPWLEAFAGVALVEMVTNAALCERYGLAPPNAKKPWAKLGLTEGDLSHFAAAEHADHGKGDDGPGHGEEALAIVAKYARTDEEQERCATALREVMRVMWYHLEQIGRSAIAATKREQTAAVSR